MDIKSGCFFFQFVFLTFSISDTYTKQSRKASWSAVEISYLCSPTLICLNKSSGLDVRPGCWAMLRPGFGLLNISTQERAALGSSPGWVSKQGPGASWHLFYLKICQHQKWWDTSPEDGDFFFFFNSWLILRMVWPTDCILLPPAIGRGHQQKKADRNARCTFSSLLFSNDCLQRLLLTGQCYLGLYF